MKENISKYLIKFALWLLPLKPSSHQLIEPIVNNWIDKLNNDYYKPQ